MNDITLHIKNGGQGQKKSTLGLAEMCRNHDI